MIEGLNQLFNLVNHFEYPNRFSFNRDNSRDILVIYYITEAFTLDEEISREDLFGTKDLEGKIVDAMNNLRDKAKVTKGIQLELPFE